MRKSKYSEQQIITLLKEVELGAKVGETCCNYGISEATYYKWKSAYGGMDASQLKQLRERKLPRQVDHCKVETLA